MLKRGSLVGHVVQIKRLEKKDPAAEVVASSCVGFSERFHLLISQVQGLDIPQRSDPARLTYIATITGHAEPAVRQWFEQDGLPSDEILQSLVRFFLHHTACHTSALRVESWLRYGEEATPNPFAGEAEDDTVVALQAKAFQLLNETVKERDILLCSYDMALVLEELQKLLKEFGVGLTDQVPASMKELVVGLLAKHSK